MNSEKKSENNLPVEKEKIEQKPSWIQQFFILCAGVDRRILYQCPTDFNKYAGIGATIFFTALLASLSGGYALYTAFFDSINAALTPRIVLISVSLGLLWGIVIFNLDRYIVLSLRKEKMHSKAEISRASTPQEKKALQMERSRVLWNQALMATPRFLIALVIAITISRPIELRLFSPRIEKELASISNTDIQQFDDNFKKQIKAINLTIGTLDKEEEADKADVYNSNPIYNTIATNVETKEANIITKNNDILDLTKKIKANTISYIEKDSLYDPSYKQWVYKTHKKFKLNGIGKKTSLKKTQKNKEVAQLNAEIVELIKDGKAIEIGFAAEVQQIVDDYKVKRQPFLDQIIQLNTNYPIERAKWIKKNNNSSDLLSRLEALGNISEKSNSVWWASTIITLLFVLLETSPVVVKLLTKRGPYDEIIDRIEYEQYINEQELISKHNMGINERLKSAKEVVILKEENDLELEKEKLEVEKKNNEVFLADISIKQKALSKIAVENWYIKEMHKLQKESENLQKIPKEQTLENKLWKYNNNGSESFYFFINQDDHIKKELWHKINGRMSVGQWQYLNNNKELEISLSGKRKQFKILEINDVNAILQAVDGTKNLEFIKVEAF